MKICVYGAGAIGGYMGAELIDAGYDVSLVARGPHLEAMRKQGLRLEIDGNTKTLPVRCTDNPEELGPQDYVIITLKAHSVTPIVEQMQPLLGEHTAVVTAQNGILWWYFHALKGPLEGQRLEIADPGGRIWDGIGPQRAIGCVVYPSCEIVAPGVVKHVAGNRFMLGEPTGEKSARVTALATAFTKAGMKAPVRRKIRDDIWFKLLGNASFNPVSVLTGATLETIGTDPALRKLIRQMMTEATAVAEKLGVRFAMDIEKRIDGGAAVGAHKTSMLQDWEAGRPLELDALVAVVTDLGRLVGVPTPTIDLILALLRAKISER